MVNRSVTPDVPAARPPADVAPDRERLRLLEAVVREAPSFLHVLRGPAFVFEFANEAYYRLVGRRDLIGRPAFEALPEAAGGGFSARLAEVLATGAPFTGREVPVTLARTPGSPPEKRLIDLAYLPLRDADGRVTRILGYGTDVTEHVRARRAGEAALAAERAELARANRLLRESAAKLAAQADTADRARQATDRARQAADRARHAADQARAAAGAERARAATILESMADAYFALDAEFRIVGVNAAMARHTGLARDALLGRVVWEVFPGPQAKVLEPHYRAAMTEGVEAHLTHAYQDARLDLTAEVDVYPAPGGGAAVFWRDVTARARAEAALRSSEARFRAIVDVVPDLLWQRGPDGETTWVNARWTAYTGQTPAAAAGSGWTRALHPDDRERSAASDARAAVEGQPVQQEQRVRAADGRYRWFRVRTAAQRDPDGHVVQWFGAATDIHAERLAREEVEREVASRTAELAAANARLAEENAARDRARDERDVLLRRLAAAEEAERRRLARELHDEAGQHLTAVALGLRALTDVVRPGSEVERRADALGALVAALGRELHDLAVRLRPRALDDFGLETALQAYGQDWSRRTGIAADVHAPTAGRLPPAVESAVYRIVQEALTNVARHSGATRAGVGVERRDGEGWGGGPPGGGGPPPPPGDPAAHDAHEPPDAAARVPGLGLLGIRERAALLGGTVEVESTAGAGTTLFVRIPAVLPAGEP